MKYKGISIHKNKYCDTWYTRIRHDGRQYYISAKSQDECYLKLKIALKQIQTDWDYEDQFGFTIAQVEKIKRTFSKTTTLAEWTNTWLKSYKQGKVRGTTYKTLSYLIKNHFNGPMFDMNITQIKPIQIENFLSEIQYDRVKENTFIYLKDIFNKAVDNEIIKHNPMATMKKPKAEKKETRALTLMEQERVETLCLSDERYTFILVALWEGLRLGELRALEWSDIDFVNNEININKSESGDGDMRTKNKFSNRIVPLFPKTKELLLKYAETHKAQQLFHHTKNYINKVLSEVLTKLNIKNITMHSLRHTFVTRCQEKNVPLYILQTWIGHVLGSAVTTKIYTHKQRDAELDAINKLIGA